MIRLRPPTWGAPRCRRSRWAQWFFQLRRLWRLAVHANDQPDRIALGVALGLFIGWLPVVGVQTLIAAIICWPLRANFAASIPGVWMSNPLTMVPMYLINNWLGSLFYGKRISWSEMQEIWDQIAEMGLWEAVVFLWSNVWHITAPMLIGGVLMGLFCAVPGYFLAQRAAWAVYRRRQERRSHYQKRVSASTGAATPLPPAPSDDAA